MTGLSEDQLEHFEENGFLVVDNLLDIDKDIQPLIDEYKALLDRLCKHWQVQGLIQESYRELPFEKRLVELFIRGCDYARHMDISLPLGHIKEDSPIHLGDAVFRLITSPRLLPVVESLIGPDIYSNPIQHVRIKPPSKYILKHDNVSSLITKTDWHQDAAVASEDADNSQVITVWVAITDATEENGCLQVVKGSHKHDVSLHCPHKGPLYIPDVFINDKAIVSAPVRKGGAVILHPKVQHCSLENTSDTFRWSFDLRYNPIGQATGRSVFPGFVVQSKTRREKPATADEWRQNWLETRHNLANQNTLTFNRWGKQASELCA